MIELLINGPLKRLMLLSWRASNTGKPGAIALFAALVFVTLPIMFIATAIGDIQDADHA